METYNLTDISRLPALTSLTSINNSKDNVWFTAAYYNQNTDSYTDLAINLDALTSYCNSYSNHLLNDITSYCSTYTSYLLHNEVQKLSANIVNLVSKLKNTNNNSSYFRNNSKKISELNPRETITYHQNHSWIPLAQYDSRINSYVNITMNLDTITTYCNSYSTYINTYSSLILDNRITYLQEHVEGTVSNNIISYAFSYSKDYFEWQFL